MPYLAWIGAKWPISSVLRGLAPANSGELQLVEPFVGGCGSALSLAPLFKSALLVDANLDLINCHIEAASNPERLLADAAPLLAGHDKARFLEIRKRWNADERTPAAFLFLNKTCFCGRMRHTPDGQLAAQYDNSGRATPLKPDRIRDFARLLGGADFRCGTFSGTLARQGTGAWVYADPPYADPDKGRGYTDYLPGGFSAADRQQLAECLAAAAERGAVVHVSDRGAAAETLYRQHGATTILPVQAYRRMRGGAKCNAMETEFIASWLSADSANFRPVGLGIRGAERQGAHAEMTPSVPESNPPLSMDYSVHWPDGGIDLFLAAVRASEPDSFILACPPGLSAAAIAAIGNRLSVSGFAVVHLPAAQNSSPAFIGERLPFREL